MSNHLIALSQQLVNVREQIKSLGGDLYALNNAGRHLMPLKPEMLYRLDPETARDAYEATCLLFSACMKYVDAQLAERRARLNTVALVKARINKGLAEGAAVALCSGASRHLLITACHAAPIPMNAIANVAPGLFIKARIANGNVLTERNLRYLQKRLAAQKDADQHTT
jgi:hypothetical protein